MDKLLPGKYSVRWFGVFAVVTVLLFAFFIGTRLFILRKTIGWTSSAGMFLLALGVSFVLNLLGHLGFLAFFSGGCAGLVAGMAGMIFFYMKHEGWSDLIGPFVLVELTLAGLAAGFALQFSLYIIRKYRESKKN